MKRSLRLSAVLAALVAVAACGSSNGTVRAAPTASTSVTQYPSGAASEQDPLSVIRAYLGNVIARNCGAARRLMLPSAQASSDLCGSRADGRIRVDAWRYGPRDRWASGTIVVGAPVDLHVVSGLSGHLPRWVAYTLSLRQTDAGWWRVEAGMFSSGATSHSPFAPLRLGLASPDTTLAPARGCRQETTSTVTVTINPDTPMPDCVIVSASQRLRVVNATNAFGQRGSAITARFADLGPRVIDRGQSATFGQPFGDYLAHGQHFLWVSYYPGADIVIWLK